MNPEAGIKFFEAFICFGGVLAISIVGISFWACYQFNQYERAMKEHKQKKV